MSDDKIIVRRAVYTAACELEEQNKTDDRVFTDWNLAEEQRDICRENGEHEKADFWHEVFDYLMTLECVAAGTPVEIID